MRLILGSQSPRRSEILSFFSIPFEQCASHFVEELVSFNGNPVTYATEISEGKAHSLATRFPKAVILTADTVVFKEGKIFNKPADVEENFAMLKELNGSWHSVFTAVTAFLPAKNLKSTACEETRVLFPNVREEALNHYHQAFKGIDKAGGYSILMGGSVIIKRIEGCFYNVAGLPLAGLQKVLKDAGIDLWHFLAS
jgi:septum formation protein